MITTTVEDYSYPICTPTKWPPKRLQPQLMATPTSEAPRRACRPPRRGSHGGSNGSGSCAAAPASDDLVTSALDDLQKWSLVFLDPEGPSPQDFSLLLEETIPFMFFCCDQRPQILGAWTLGGDRLRAYGKHKISSSRSVPCTGRLQTFNKISGITFTHTEVIIR